MLMAAFSTAMSAQDMEQTTAPILEETWDVQHLRRIFIQKSKNLRLDLINLIIQKLHLKWIRFFICLMRKKHFPLLMLSCICKYSLTIWRLLVVVMSINQRI